MASATRLFWREFRREFETTGAIAPSGRALSQALARFVRDDSLQVAPRRLLEVGPGTGSVTRYIVGQMQATDTLCLVETNANFVAHLRKRFAAERAFEHVHPRTEIVESRVEEMPGSAPFDVIISGLPLNNFTPQDVTQILRILWERLAPGGHLSFFQYIAIRRVKRIVSRRGERQRLAAVDSILSDFLRDETRREAVLANLPPAWVHHLQKPVEES